MNANDSLRAFADDVRHDLTRTPKHLNPKYFYDALGSCLFEAICRLPWYHIARAEHRLLRTHSAAIITALRDSSSVIELGCGSGEKIAVLAQALHDHGGRASFHLIDISPQALELSERALGRLPQVCVLGYRSTYEIGLQAAAAQRTLEGTLLVLFLGSNIGNFDAVAAGEFLGMIRRTLRRGDLLLLGADLVKPESELRLAYDDPLGVTAAFNKNLLLRINRELQGNFNLDTFDHRILWNAGAARVEMHLVSRITQKVRIPGASCTIPFAAGESIWTESSHKYAPEGIVRMASDAGFTLRQQWIETSARFALGLFESG